MSTSPVSPNPLATPTSASSSSSSSSSSAAQSSINALSDPNTFLQLLVAQLKYQDPESPADGTTFVTQLATFAGVQQQTQMRTDLDSIDSIAQEFASSAPTTPTSTSPTAAATANTSASSPTSIGTTSSNQ
jgi:flagellar basal-body rod modification protein FlgD